MVGGKKHSVTRSRSDRRSLLKSLIIHVFEKRLLWLYPNISNTSLWESTYLCFGWGLSGWCRLPSWGVWRVGAFGGVCTYVRENLRSASAPVCHADGGAIWQMESDIFSSVSLLQRPFPSTLCKTLRLNLQTKIIDSMMGTGCYVQVVMMQSGVTNTVKVEISVCDLWQCASKLRRVSSSHNMAAKTHIYLELLTLLHLHLQVAMLHNDMQRHGRSGVKT